MWELEDFTEIRRWYALHLLLCITFFISSLIINIIQFLLYFTLRPFNKELFRNINYYLMYSLMSQILFLAEWWSNSDVVVYTSEESFKLWGKEHAIIIMNHKYEVDWLMGWIVADRATVLGAAKVFVKNILKFIPTIGWAWSVSDVIFLHRNWQVDKSIMEEQIREFYDYPYPIWMLLFSEGTRFTEDKHKASMEIARQKGLPELKHHLLPRAKGFIQCVQSLKGHFPAIYDVTIGFNLKDGVEPTLLNILRGQRVLGELYVRRLPLSDVPVDNEGASKYLHKLYEGKDKLLDNYLNTGNFSSNGDFPAYKGRSPPRRYWSLLNIICWAIIVITLILKQYYYLLTTGSLLANSIAIGIVLIAYIALYKMIGLTRIDKGSKYGNKDSDKVN